MKQFLADNEERIDYRYFPVGWPQLNPTEGFWNVSKRNSLVHEHTILIKDPDKITLAIEIWITYSKTKWSTNILKSNLNNTRSTIRDLGCA